MAINVIPGHPDSGQLLFPGLNQLNYFGARQSQPLGRFGGDTL
jgi:hypothetical protein